VRELPAEDELAKPPGPRARALLERFAAAVENAGACALAGLLAEDVALEMPPLLTWFTGRAAVARYFAAQPFVAPGRLRLIAVTANQQLAFASYVRERDGTYHAHAVTLPTLTGTGIARIITFRQPGLFGPFGLPQEYSPAGLAAAQHRPVPPWPR
jgi:RNA polymerase sigma-70 factor (ECF subfamily)